MCVCVCTYMSKNSVYSNAAFQIDREKINCQYLDQLKQSYMKAGVWCVPVTAAHR